MKLFKGFVCNINFVTKLCYQYLTNFDEIYIDLLQDPVQDFSTPIKGLHDWFTSQKIEGKREELRDLIIELKEKYESKADEKENNT